MGPNIYLKFQHTNLLPGLGLHVHLFSIIQNNVHVLVKSNNVSLHTHVDILVEPYLYSRSCLQVPENQVLKEKFS